MTDFVDELCSTYKTKRAQVGIIGLGYAGLPLASAFAASGFQTVGFETDPDKVTKLNQGHSYIEHIASDHLASLVASHRLRATSDFGELAKCDAIMICVPTPLGEGRAPDLQFVINTSRRVKEHLHRGQLVVLESTTYPGTTDEVLFGTLRDCGLRVGEDFFVAFSPEREDPANPEFTTRNIPKLVGGVTPNCTRVACAAYGGVVNEVIPVSSAKVAEAAKLVENIFRCVNIAMVNELKLLFERMEIDVWEVIRAASTKPFGFTPFYPGPGLGGHCIPIDPFYLSWKARQYGFATRFIELAGEINTSMPAHVVDRLGEALNTQGKAFKDASILLIGVAYKRDVDDYRESPALSIINILESKLARVSYHDPHVPHLHSRNLEHDLNSVALTPEVLVSADAIVIVTDHSSIDYSMLLEHARLIVDTRNATARYRTQGDNIVMA